MLSVTDGLAHRCTVQRFPPEILSHIFVLGRQDFTLHEHAATNFLISVTAVCGFWREVGLSTSTLWTSIYYNEGIGSEDTKPEPEKVCARIKAFFKRSKNASLDILLSCRATELESGIAVIELIRPHLQRCRSIRADLIEFFGDRSPLRCLLPLPGPMPRLSELRICMSVNSHHLPVSIAEPSNASPLTLLHLLGRGTVDLSHVKSTMISDLVVNEVIEVTGRSDERELRAQCSKSLTSLASVDFEWDPEVPLPVVELPNLKQISTSLAALGDVPQAILCPNVEELVLYLPKIFRRPVQSARVGLFPAAHFPWEKLRTLKLDFETRFSAEYNTILAAFPNLTTIICYEIGNGSLALDVLVNISTTLSLVPKLSLFQLLSPGPKVERLHAPILMILKSAYTLRPSLHVECARGCLWLADDEFDAAREAYPDRFIEIPCVQGALDHLYGVKCKGG